MRGKVLAVTTCVLAVHRARDAQVLAPCQLAEGAGGTKHRSTATMGACNQDGTERTTMKSGRTQEPCRPSVAKDPASALGRPRWTRVYRHRLLDGERWRAYTPRDGDIIVCSAYKAGTTWLQTITALVVFQTPELPMPLAALSPWLELPREPIEEVVAALDAQTHRRIIKTHVPLDALPYSEGATYLFIGRDPRDVFVSLMNHIANVRNEVRLLNGERPWPCEEIPDDPRMFFRKWITSPGVPGERDGWPAWSLFSHTESFWRYRGCANIHLFHFSDLKADLDAQMRRVSAILDMPVNDESWPRLVDAARFQSMKRDVARFGHAGPGSAFIDPSAFFRSGRNGQWRGLLGDTELALYRRVLAERVTPDLADWLATGGPVPGEPALRD